MLERNLETKVCDWAEKMGGKALKLVDEGETGWPDRTIFLPNRTILIPELKRPKKNKRSYAQQRRIAWLKSLGFPTAFIESMAELRQLYMDFYE